MESYKKEFIHFMLECGALSFGEFSLSSGRKSPFYMNAGAYVTGSQLSRLGEFYAQAIAAHFGLDFDILFGPAYKGIPLAVATAIALEKLYGREIRYAANRKEPKDHGDAGLILGSKIRDGDRVVIIEDVTSSGQSIRGTYPLIMAQADASVIGLVVSLDRCERGRGAQSGLAEIAGEYGLSTCAIVTMPEVVAYLHNREIDGRVCMDDVIKRAIVDYYGQYGAL